MAYESYKVRVYNAQDQQVGTTRLYFGLNQGYGQGYYWGADPTVIQSSFRNDTGTTMDFNGMFGMDPSVTDSLGWNPYWAGYITRFIQLQGHTEQLKYKFSTGSYIVIDPFEYRSSDGQYSCAVRYYLENGTLVLSSAITARAWNWSGQLYHNQTCECSCLPWKGYLATTSTYRFTKLSCVGNAMQNFCSVSIGYVGVNRTLAEQFFDGLIPEDPDDPYPDVPDSEPDVPDDPDGLPDDDPIDIPDIPNIEVVDTGFITLFSPTLTQLRALASYMWSSFFDLATFKKLFADPMDCILGLNLIPFTVNIGEAKPVSIGNISTGVYLNTLASQWVTVNCGSLNIGKIYDSYLDFAPYCKWSIYLPFIGIINLNADDVAHESLNLVYHIDVLSCACVAYLKAGDHVLYQFSGSCGYEIPVSSNNFASMIANMVAIGASVVSAGVTAAGSAMAAGAEEGIASAGSVSAHNVMGLKPDVKRGGSLGSAASFLSMGTPYVILEVPNMCKPQRQPHYTGYPAYITRTVGSVSGYVEFDSIVVNGLPCTDTERQMVEDILKGGAYV